MLLAVTTTVPGQSLDPSDADQQIISSVLAGDRDAFDAFQQQRVQVPQHNVGHARFPVRKAPPPRRVGAMIPQTGRAGNQVELEAWRRRCCRISRAQRITTGIATSAVPTKNSA